MEVRRGIGTEGAASSRIGETPPPYDLRGVPERAARLEARGYDILSTIETGHDPFLPALLAAQGTERAKIMTGVAIAFPRAPYITANIAWDLAQLSKGRFILGLGTQVKGHNERRFSVPWVAPGPRLRDYILCIRAIWDTWQNGTKPDFVSDHYQFTLTSPVFSAEPIDYPDIKIVNGCLNPYNARLAGEVADGVLFHGFNSFAYTREVLLPALHEGARRAGRDPSELFVSGFGQIVTGRTEEEVAAQRERVRRSSAFFGATRAYWSVMKHHGWDEEAALLNRLALEQRWDEMPGVITDEMLDQLTVSGTWDEIAGKMRERYAGLCTSVSFSAEPENPDEEDQIREVVAELQRIPALGEAEPVAPPA